MGVIAGGISAWQGQGAGLVLSLRTPPAATADPVEALTEEAGIVAPRGSDIRLDMQVDEDAVVAEGAVLARLRHAPDICFVAPMPCRVARIRLRPGRRLGEIVLFRERGSDCLHHDVASAETSAGALARLLQIAGFWPRVRRRPYGTMPSASERPAAIFVMACDTRPFAPDTRFELSGREEALARGLAALARLTDGPVVVCHGADDPLRLPRQIAARVTVVPVGSRHPQGLAGIRIHARCPASDQHPVWDLHAGDAADLGDVLATGRLPQRRVVQVAGPALSKTRLLRCQIGADLRGLSHGAVRPGAHVILAGSPIDGQPARWLGPRDRQVSVLPEPEAPAERHWLISALTRSSRPRPLIPTAALSQAAGGAFPVLPLLRALAAGDDETATRLGAQSLLEEDLALVDYVVGGQPRSADLLRAYLDRKAAEVAP